MDSWLNELNWKTKTAFLKSHRGCVVLFTDETRSCLMAGDGCGVELESNMQSDVFNQLQPMVFGVSWRGCGDMQIASASPTGMGLRSGELAGHTIRSMPSPARNAVDVSLCVVGH